MRILAIAIATMAVAACANDPAPPARSPSSTQTTSGAVLGPGYSGSKEYGLTNGPDGTPYRGNQDPSNPASNREPRKEQRDVRTAPIAE